MKPVDNNPGIRTQRSEIEARTSRSQETQRSPGATAGASADGVERSAESVSLTQTAADLLRLETQLRELPGVDQARVDSLRQAIDNGSYQINPERIVDSLLQTERELG